MKLWWLKLFFPKGPSKCFGMNIVRPLSETEPGNRFVVAIEDRYNKLTKLILTQNKNGLTVVHSFLEY